MNEALVVGATASERAVSILTAYCMSRDHNLAHTEGADVAGIAFFDLIDEILDPLAEAETEEEFESSRDMITRTIVNILGITEALLDALEVDPFDMIPTIVQENLWREACP